MADLQHTVGWSQKEVPILTTVTLMPCVLAARTGGPDAKGASPPTVAVVSQLVWIMRALPVVLKLWSLDQQYHHHLGTH